MIHRAGMGWVFWFWCDLPTPREVCHATWMVLNPAVMSLEWWLGLGWLSQNARTFPAGESWCVFPRIETGQLRCGDVLLALHGLTGFSRPPWQLSSSRMQSICYSWSLQSNTFAFPSPRKAGSVYLCLPIGATCSHLPTQTHTDTHRHTQTHTDTHRHTQTHTDTHRHTQTHTDTHRHTQTHTHRHTHTQNQNHTESHRITQNHTESHRITHITHIFIWSYIYNIWSNSR